MPCSDSKSEKYTWLNFLFVCIFQFLSVSCSEQPSIKTYTIPSEYKGPVVSWKLPENWGENPDLSGPMAGSFHIVTKTGQKGRIGVMPFRENVSTVDVANMFSREMGLPSFDEDSIKSVITEKNIGNRTFEWLRLQELGTTSPQTRTALLALLRQEGETWLFPFIADQQIIDQELNNFSNFLESCTLRSAKNKPIVALSPVPQPAKNKITTKKPPNPWSWKIPENWLPGKKSSMRVGSFMIGNDQDNSVDISITSFPGDVGGLLANVNRWIGQIDLPPINDASLPKYCSSFKLSSSDGHFVEAYGEKKGLLAGILFLENESWFFKMMGDLNLVKKEKQSFIDFLKSIKEKG